MKECVTAEVLDERLARFEAICRQAGLKLTKQRLEVFRVVAGTTTHPDVDSVFRQVRKTLPQISLDTVYRTLGSLESLGLISRVNALSTSYRFDANVTTHDHFVCTQCGLIRDVPGVGVGASSLSGKASVLGSVDSVHVELRGVCNECRDGEANP